MASAEEILGDAMVCERLLVSIQPDSLETFVDLYHYSNDLSRAQRRGSRYNQGVLPTKGSLNRQSQ